VTLRIEWPTGGLSTNGVDFFACGDLLTQNWSLIATTNIDLSSNEYSWVASNASNVTRRFYDCWTLTDSDGDGLSDGREVRLHGTDPADWDTDDDGVSDGEELDDGTSPLDGDDPPNLSGVVSYSGLMQPGATIIIKATGYTTPNHEITISEPGAYIFPKLAPDRYNIRAYVDQDDSQWQNGYEPTDTVVDVSVTNQVVNINLSLSDVDSDGDELPDWWEYQFFSHPTDTLPALDWDDDTLSNLMEYGLGTDPTDVDTDGDRMGDATEVAREFNPVEPPAGYTQYMGLPFSEPFEAPGVVTGDLNGQHRWAASPTGQALVQTGTVHLGSQALELSAGTGATHVEHIIGSVGASVVWVDLYARIDHSSITPYRDHPDIATAPEHTVSVFTMNSEGDIYAYNGSSEAWELATPSGGVTGNVYHRYTVKQDYGDKEWDLYVDNVLLKSDLGFRDESVLEFTQFSMTGTKGGNGYCDDISIGTTKPAGIP
jgi:hypothetical protein